VALVDQVSLLRERLPSPVTRYGSTDSTGCHWVHAGEEEEAICRKLKYFFMSPCDKYHAKGRYPFKLILQLAKIFFVTAQVHHILYFNLLIVLTSFSIPRYLALPETTVGRYAYVYNRAENGSALFLCQQYYKKGHIDPANDTFSIDPRVIKGRAVSHLKSSIFCIFHFLITQQSTVVYSTVGHCLGFFCLVWFGFFFMTSDKKASFLLFKTCVTLLCFTSAASGSYTESWFSSVFVLLENIFKVVCYKKSGQENLLHEFVKFFKTTLDRKVCWGDRLEFINGWYILLIISDIFTITGSFIKIGIETKNISSYDLCAILLGTSTLLVWVGVIRYLTFFQKYNILIVTLRAAFPNVIRFCCCVAAIYLGYCFCGWIVLGPYHVKFRSLSMVSECLFSLINGDDMFVTFAEMQETSPLVWLFSQVYLYTFISLFIYMVLSLFIALITGAYETIKHQTQEPIHITDLHAFIAECTDAPNSGKFRGLETSPCSFFCCCDRTTTYEDVLLVN
uniref:Mucolipin-1-like n=1 Tax=Pundamilia nyererei TaxID=303518 RepID=A0A3B4GK72_9CICH